MLGRLTLDAVTTLGGNPGQPPISDYSPGGNVFKVTDPRGVVTQFGYDMLNRKIQG